MNREQKDKRFPKGSPLNKISKEEKPLLKLRFIKKIQNEIIVEYVKTMDI